LPPLYPISKKHGIVPVLCLFSHEQVFVHKQFSDPLLLTFEGGSDRECIEEKKKALLSVSFFFFFSKDSVKLILKGSFLVPNSKFPIVGLQV
jgi:hypothetical protein